MRVASGDEEPNSRTSVLRWRIWSLRRTVSIGEILIMNACYVPFTKCDPALIGVFCSRTRRAQNGPAFLLFA
jgi:hypothetical protein